MSITKVTLPKDTPVLLANSADVVSLQNLSSRPINITTTSAATPTPNITTVDSMRLKPTGDIQPMGTLTEFLWAWSSEDSSIITQVD